MSVKRIHWAVFLFLFSTLFSFHAFAADNLVVVVHKSNQLSELSKKQVIDIYMGRFVSFPNGDSASPIDLPSATGIKGHFYQLLVNQNERKIKSYWSRLLFSGRAKPPIEVTSTQEAVTMVEQQPDAIAYLSRELVTSEMKIVFQFEQ